MTGLMGTKIAACVNRALAFVYPEWCQICDNARATPDQGYVCETCQAAVKKIQPPYCETCGRPYEGNITGPFTCSQCRQTPLSYAFARSAALAEGTLLEAIHRYKYNGALYIEPFLARLLVESASGTVNPSGWDGIVPVPLHPKKQRSRQFNQAERLARRLSKATAVPLRTDLLRRVTATRTQTKLTREERFENVRRAFEMKRNATARGLRLVVVDDVFTTGATTNACAETLLDGGADLVCVWTVARGT